MSRRRSRRPLLLLIVACTLLVPRSVAAHGATPAGVPQTIVQGIGPYELAITMRVPKAPQAPWSVQIMPEQRFGEAVTVMLWVVPTGAPVPAADAAQVVVTDAARDLTPLPFPLAHPGDYELALRVSGPHGGGEARIPFTMAVQPTPWAIGVMLGALGLSVALTFGALGVRVFAHRRRLPLPARLPALLTGSLLGCVTIAIGAFLTTQFLPPGGAGATTNAAPSGRPYVNVVLHVDATMAAVGRSVPLLLEVTDGGTGLPVDDLVPDHDALMHLVVTSADRGYFRHLHPARIAPGRYFVTIAPDRPGAYTAYTEVMRRDSGTQVIARPFTVSGAATGTERGTAPGIGTRAIGDVTVVVAASRADIRAGDQVELAFTFAVDDHPLPLAPYLGMAGHLLATNTACTLFGHIHALDTVRAPPAMDAPVGGFALLPTPTPEPVSPASTVHFAYTFPEPGRYTLWAQVKRADTNLVVTVPVSVDVAPVGDAP